jgi:hypothetical protein
VIDIEQIRVNVRMPSDEVRIVAMQPFIRFQPAPEEPFRWSNDAVEMQLAAIHRTLDTARDGFGGRFANFTLFPEYAIPGLAGVAAINDRISANDWSNESIIIAGVHGIPKAEYRDLCDVLSAHVSQANAPDSVPDDKWVNCCVIWVKDREGVIRKWVQPKVRPAWPEMNVTCNDMFCGSYLYVFECQYEPSDYPCRFVTMICFDWVASVAGNTVCKELLSKLNQLWTQSQPPLDWVFVVQCNTKPNHFSFLNSTYQFLTDPTYPFVQRDKAVVVHANTAVSRYPARTGKGGFSACVFSPSAQFDCKCCRPTVCMQPSSLRANKTLERCHDIVFREMGECIHTFTVRVPRFVTPDATDRTYPLSSAHVYATCETTDPRLCGGSVPAAVKWVNDSLDVIKRLSATELADCSLNVNAKAIEPDIIAGMRKSDGHTASDCVNWALCSFSHKKESRDEIHRQNADLWEADEANAIEHVFHSLTCIGLSYNLTFESALLHGTIQVDEDIVQVIAIFGDTPEDCRIHYDQRIPLQGTDPVLVIVNGHYSYIPKPEEFLRSDETADEKGVAFLDYKTLVTNCRNAADSNSLRRRLDDFLPRHRRII